MKSIASLFILLLSLNAYSAAPWYTSKVVQVTTQGDGYLFIRTELNPNPAGCSSSWAGAYWNGESDKSHSLASSIALAAQMSGKEIRFQIDDTSCGVNNGWPKMLWIQVQ